MAGILKYRLFFKDWSGERPDPQRLVASAGDLFPATLVDALYSQYARQKSSLRWGDKSPIYTLYIDLLAEIFPQAQFIHIYRDGRDVALSMLKAYQTRRFFYIDVCYAAHSWKQRVSKARRDGLALGGDRYLEMAYEDLVSQPLKKIPQICAFLGEAYEPSMAQPHTTARQLHHSKGIHSPTRKPLNTKSVARWKTGMSVRDRRLFQRIAGETLDILGYEIEPLGKMSPAEAARFARLQTKYHLIESGRKFIQTAGIFHPTQLISRRLKPYPKLSAINPEN
jgi:hypothetical protein